MLAVDIGGRRYGRLTAVERTNQRTNAGNFLWRCRCDCGRETVVAAGNLQSGGTRSCGCLSRHTNKRHGESAPRTREYSCWKDMRARCNWPSHKSFKDYGGRGIKICKRWQAFENFLADMGRCPPGMSLDRINPDGNYEPSNCRWASALVQRHNRSRR